MRLNYFGGWIQGWGCVGDTGQVGSYPSGASPYSALDVSGNVEEWVSDWYDADYYGVSPYSNPLGPATGTYKVQRGGRWWAPWDFIRVAYRSLLDPTYGTSTIPPPLPSGHGGFRCAASP